MSRVESQSAVSFELPGPEKVEPTVSGRIPVYDFVRGVAIFGILLANIPWFAGPEFAEMMSVTSLPGTALDETVGQWTLALVTGKFRSMLAMLFGIGIWLQYQKRSQVAGNWPGGYLKRTLILAGFGLVHGLLIWHGDILFMYAGTAFVVCLVATFSERVLRWIIGVSFGLAVLAGIGLFLASFADLGNPGAMNQDLMALGLTKEAETAAFSHGTYFDQIEIRAPMFLMMASGLIAFLPFLGGLFLFGVLLARHGVLQAPSQHPKVRNRMLAVGFGIGLPMNLVSGVLMDAKSAFWLQNATEICFGPLMAIGYVMLLAIAAERGWLKRVQSALAKVGRMAFSNYILQSLLGTAVFYSWGGGLFNQLNRLEILGVAAGIWAANLAFTYLWLARHQMGPLEWLWRSLTEGRKMPLRSGAG